MKVDVQQVPEFYRPYFNFIGEESIQELLTKSKGELNDLLMDLSEEKALYRYEEGKWSIKDLVQHIIDSERIFAYRALRFARNDSTDLSGFDQNDYVDVAGAHDRSLQELIEEFNILRGSTIHLFQSFNEDQLNNSGTANQYQMSVRILGYLISGHLLHHLKIIRERYL